VAWKSSRDVEEFAWRRAHANAGDRRCGQQSVNRIGSKLKYLQFAEGSTAKHAAHAADAFVAFVATADWAAATKDETRWDSRMVTTCIA
jgi:hypothetical protein